MEELSVKLNTGLLNLAPMGANYSASIKESTDTSDNYWFYDQIIQTAKKLEYYANLEAYKSWIRLTIMTQDQFELVISFHSINYSFQGILVVSAFTLKRVANEEGGKDVSNLKQATQ
ncbi:hypothetical protein [Nostoc sp.]|uniref:hypothetical protein n=1 Tax=Nostoc sp. TaxID=1180 RepID=UPI002FF760B8